MARDMVWVRDPHSGGVPIPPRHRETIVERLERYGAEHFAGRYQRLDIRFRGAFCYVDAYGDGNGPADVPLHLCRLRHFALERWGVDIYTYSNEKYSPTIGESGDGFMSLEEGFHLAARLYLS